MKFYHQEEYGVVGERKPTCKKCISFCRCGHCIHFAPTFKQLAADVYGAFFLLWQNLRFVAKVPDGHNIRDLQQKFHVAIIPSGWRDVMGIAAIDCALEENMPTCREYEVTNKLLDHSLKKGLKVFSF